MFNRRAFLTLLDKAISNAQRTQTTLPVLVMDLDHFKKVNDSWGRRAGDDVLRHFVMLAQRCLRKEDVMGRLGGEEFAIFLPNAGAGGAVAVAERLRARVEAHPVVTEQRSIALAVSVGVTVCTGSESAGTALQRADEAMYLAKERGRNRGGDDSGRRSAPCPPRPPPTSLPRGPPWPHRRCLAPWRAVSAARPWRWRHGAQSRCRPSQSPFSPRPR